MGSRSSVACALMVSWYRLIRRSERLRAEQLAVAEGLHHGVVHSGLDDLVWGAMRVSHRRPAARRSRHCSRSRRQTAAPCSCGRRQRRGARDRASQTPRPRGRPPPSLRGDDVVATRVRGWPRAAGTFCGDVIHDEGERWRRRSSGDRPSQCCRTVPMSSRDVHRFRGIHRSPPPGNARGLPPSPGRSRRARGWRP